MFESYDLSQPPGETSFEHHTVLLGEEGTVKDAIGSLTTHEIHELNKLLPRLGRLGQDDYATRRALREANGAEIKLRCNVCFDRGILSQRHPMSEHTFHLRRLLQRVCQQVFATMR